MRKAAILLILLFSASYASAQSSVNIHHATLMKPGERTPEIPTAELRKILAEKSATVFDARPFKEFAVSLIPGAVSLSAKPGVEKAVYVSDAAEIGRVLKGNKAAPIVLYCNGIQCLKSARLAADLMKEGHTNVRRYQLGIPVWRALGGVTQIEPWGIKYVYEKDKTAVFLDARGPDEFRAGSIPNTRNVPRSGVQPGVHDVGEIRAAKNDGRLPYEDHNTRIIVFGRDAKQALEVAEALAWEAFHNVSYFAGTFEEFRVTVAEVGHAAGQEQVTFAQNGDAKLRVFVEGSGPAIVFLPGQGRGPRDFDEVAKHLVSAGYRVIRPEPRGFGESVGPIEGVTLRDNARDVAAAIEKVGAAPAIVAGWAYGNRVARLLASERPELVRGIVLIAAGGKFPPRPEAMTGLRTVQDKSLPLEKRAEAARNVLYGPKSSIPATEMRLDEVSPATIKAQSLSPTVPLEAWWDGGKAPMLVLQGLHDVIAPPENGRSLRQDHPGRVTLVEFEDLGHSMVRERPDLVADAIITWAKKLK